MSTANQLLPRQRQAGHSDRYGPRADGCASGVLSSDQLGQLAGSVAQADSWRSIIRFTAEERWFRRLALTDDY